MDIQAAIDGLVGSLTSAGLSASADNQGLNAPCCYVHTGPIKPRDLAGGYTMTMDVTLIAPNTSQKGNLKALNDMLELALSVLEPDGPIETDAVASVRDKNLPAFTFPVDIDL